MENGWNGWLSGIGVVKFDVEFGNRLEILYPKSFWDEFTELEAKDIAYLSFPDSTTMKGQEPCSLYCFKIRDYYVFVHFNQDKDPESPRGYKMESVLLFSKYPFLKLFKKVIRVVAASYLFISNKEKEMKTKDREGESEGEGELNEDGNNQSDQNVMNFFEKVFSETGKWPFIECNRRYRRLSFFKKVYNYKTPMMTIYNQPFFSINDGVRTRSRHHSSPTESLNVSFSPHTNRSRRNERIKSVYQNEVNIYHTFRSHIKTLPKLWEILILNQGPILVLSPSPKYSSETILGLSTIIQPIPDIALEVRPYFTVNCSGYQSYIDIAEFDSHKKEEEGKNNNGNDKGNNAVTNNGGVLFKESNYDEEQKLKKKKKEEGSNGAAKGKTVILGATNPFFLKAYVSWPHLLAIGEQPPKPETTSVVDSSKKTNGGAELIMKKLSSSAAEMILNKKKKKGGQIVLGCPESKKRGISERLMWEYEEIFVTCRKRFVINDSQLIKDMNIVTESPMSTPTSPLEFLKFGSNTPTSHSESEESSSNNSPLSNPFQNVTGRNLRLEKRNNENIRKAFRDWTVLFLSPLQECFRQLKKLYLFPLFLKTEAEKILTLQKFYNYLKKNPKVWSAQKRRLFRKKEAKDSVVLVFYKQFLMSQNFRAWLNLKINYEYYKSLENIQLKKVVNSMNEVGVMDFFMRVSKDHRIQKARVSKSERAKRVCDYIDPKVVKKLSVILMEIISLSPPVLRPSMLKHIKIRD